MANNRQSGSYPRTARFTETSAAPPEFANSPIEIKGQPSPAKIQHRLKLAELLACPPRPNLNGLFEQCCGNN
jgi:hypothetical protein